MPRGKYFDDCIEEYCRDKCIDLANLVKNGRERYLQGLSEDQRLAAMNIQDMLNEGRFPRSKEPVELQRIYYRREMGSRIQSEDLNVFRQKRQLFTEQTLAKLNNNNHPYWIWVSFFCSFFNCSIIFLYLFFVLRLFMD